MFASKGINSLREAFTAYFCTDRIKETLIFLTTRLIQVIYPFEINHTYPIVSVTVGNFPTGNYFDTLQIFGNIKIAILRCNFTNRAKSLSFIKFYH